MDPIAGRPTPALVAQFPVDVGLKIAVDGFLADQVQIQKRQHLLGLQKMIWRKELIPLKVIMRLTLCKLKNNTLKVTPRIALGNGICMMMGLIV